MKGNKKVTVKEALWPGDETEWDYKGELDAEGKACGRGYAAKAGGWYRYSGEWLDDRIMGIGEYNGDGRELSGEWRNGRPHGKFEDKSVGGVMK